MNELISFWLFLLEGIIYIEDMLMALAETAIYILTMAAIVLILSRTTLTRTYAAMGS